MTGLGMKSMGKIKSDYSLQTGYKIEIGEIVLKSKCG
jgi:hypothetical protein